MTIKGKLTQTGDGYPIAGVKMTLTQTDDSNNVASVMTQEDGSYVFHDVKAANYKLQAMAFGVPYDEPVIVANEDINKTSAINTGFKFGLQTECDCNTSIAAIPTAGRRSLLSINSSYPTTISSVTWNLQPAIPGAQSGLLEFDTVVPLGLRKLRVEAVAHEVTGSNTPYGGGGGASGLGGGGGSGIGGTGTGSGSGTIGGAGGLGGQGNSSSGMGGASIYMNQNYDIAPGPVNEVNVGNSVRLQEPVAVRLQRTASDPTLDQALWVAIRNRTRALSFDRYRIFMNRALRWEERDPFKGIQTKLAQELGRDIEELGTHLHGVGAYQTLKLLTETFLLLECGVRIQRTDGRDHVPFDSYSEARRLGQPFSIEEMETRLKDYLGERAQLPYITRVVRAAFPELEREGADGRLIAARINEPLLIELIWSYWMEEGMLVQTMNAISQRFQNVRSAGERGDRDPLLNLEIDPLRPLNNLLWGFIQDEYNRLSVRRRAYEYDHQYGLTLYGKAATGMRPADSRSKFLEAFHNLLYQTSVFFKEDFQTTVIADGFPLLNSLREVHLLLSQGAQNQCGDLPWTARAEMMLMQYMLSRREIHDFLQARVMVAYREPWEPQVDAMKTLQGWTDVTVSHFRDLAVYGEQLMLSIRYGDWIADNDEYSAINWARYFRPEIQGYLHAYRAATGVDLTNSEKVDSTIPGILLQKRMVQQRARP